MYSRLNGYYYQPNFKQSLKIRCFSCKKKFASINPNCTFCGAKNGGHIKYAN